MEKNNTNNNGTKTEKRKRSLETVDETMPVPPTYANQPTDPAFLRKKKRGCCYRSYTDCSAYLPYLTHMYNQQAVSSRPMKKIMTKGTKRKKKGRGMEKEEEEEEERERKKEKEKKRKEKAISGAGG